MVSFKLNWPLANCNVKTSVDFLVAKGVVIKRNKIQLWDSFLFPVTREESRVLCVKVVYYFLLWVWDGLANHCLIRKIMGFVG